MKEFALSNGVNVPALAYGNEEGVGKGIKETGIKRENIFISTKSAKKAI